VKIHLTDDDRWKDVKAGLMQMSLLVHIHGPTAARTSRQTLPLKVNEATYEAAGQFEQALLEIGATFVANASRWAVSSAPPRTARRSA
jgi:hypothetical protein